MQVQKVKALKPFVGAYPCSAQEADYTQNEMRDAGNGVVSPVPVSYKKFVMNVAHTRNASAQEVEEDKMQEQIARSSGRPYVSPLTEDRQSVHIEADPLHLELPVDFIAKQKLVERGLVELVGKPRAKGGA